MTPPLLTTISLGGTLGRVVGDGADVSAVLARLVPNGFDLSLIDGDVRRALDTTSEITPALVRLIDDRLLIDDDMWPDPWPSVDLEFFDGAEDALDRLSKLGPVVVVCNLPVTAKRAMDRLISTFGHYLAAAYASYDLGERKPSKWLFKKVAEARGCKVGDIVHVGDSFTEDVLCPIGAGARGAVWLQDQWPRTADTLARGLHGRCQQVSKLSYVPDAVAAILDGAA